VDAAQNDAVIDRRKAALALVGVAATIAAAPKDAKADISFSELVKGVRDGIEETSLPDDLAATAAETLLQRQILEAAFRVFREIGIPSRFITLLNQLLSLLGSAGQNSMTLSGTIPGAMEISWPEIAVHSAVARQAQSIEAARATRARVQETASICATAAQAQGELAAEDAAVLAATNAAGAAGNVTTILQGIAALIATNGQRLSYQIMMQDAQGQILCDMALREQAPRWLGPQVREHEREGIPDTLAPTTITR
jgi:hypothetical protein